MIGGNKPFRIGSRMGERLNPLNPLPSNPEPTPTPALTPEPTRQDDSGKEG